MAVTRRAFRKPCQTSFSWYPPIHPHTQIPVLYVETYSLGPVNTRQTLNFAVHKRNILSSPRLKDLTQAFKNPIALNSGIWFSNRSTSSELCHRNRTEFTGILLCGWLFWYLPAPLSQKWSCFHFKFPPIFGGFFSACFCGGRKNSHLN